MPDNYIYGLHSVEEALYGERSVEKILIQRGIRKEGITELLKKANELDIPVQFVPVEKLNRLHRNHQGIIAMISSVRFYKTEDILAQAYERGELPLLVICDRITDVRNFGAIARTAWCSGVHALIIPFTETAAVNAEAVKASAGALNKIAVCREKNLVTLIKQLKLNGIQILAAESGSKRFIFETDLRVPTVVILGSEGMGINPQLLRIADELVRIPMKGDFDSLNVSVAAGIILYEVLKQRQFQE